MRQLIGTLLEAGNDAADRGRPARASSSQDEASSATESSGSQLSSDGSWVSSSQRTEPEVKSQRGRADFWSESGKPSHTLS